MWHIQQNPKKKHYKNHVLMYAKPRKANIKTQSKNTRKLWQKSNNKERTWNCKIKDDCPVYRICLTTWVIYTATGNKITMIWYMQAPQEDDLKAGAVNTCRI